jgi:hypothetical protein
MIEWIGALQQDASKYIDDLGALTRETVHQYYLPLWLWHRLDADRWKASSLPLRESKRGSLSLDVDHVVAVKFWETLTRPLKPESAGLSGMPESDDLSVKMNALGNCFLLEKSFNIAKGAEPLQSFLARVHEFKNGAVTVEAWAKDIGLAAILVNATGKTIDDVSTAVDERTTSMKNELKEYIVGGRQRADLNLSTALAPKSLRSLDAAIIAQTGSRSTPMSKGQAQELLSRIDPKSVELLTQIAANDGEITWGEIRSIFDIKEIGDTTSFTARYGKGITRSLRNLLNDKSARLIWWNDEDWSEESEEWDQCKVYVDGSALQALRDAIGKISAN